MPNIVARSRGASEAGAGIPGKPFALSLSNKFNVAFLAILLMAGFNVISIHGMIRDVDGVVETVNVAGKLRMLSQKIAFQTLNSSAQPEFVQQALTDIDDYETALTALERSGFAFGYQVRQVGASQQALVRDLRLDWDHFRQLIEPGLLEPQFAPAAPVFAAVSTRATSLLLRAERLVDDLTREAGLVQQHMLQQIYLIFVVEALIFALLMFVIRRRIVLPLVEIVHKTRDLARGNYRGIINFHSNDELGDLVRTFNLASAQIGRLVEQIEHERGSLLKAEAMFRGIAENSVVGVYIMQDERFLFVNQRMAGLFMYEQQQMLNTLNPLDLFIEEHQAVVTENIRRRFAGEVDNVIYEVDGIKADGTIVPVEVFGSFMELNGRPATVGVVLDITLRQTQKMQLEYLANHDPLTGLANRNFLTSQLRKAIAIADRQQGSVALLLFDMDQFKVVNDSLGHEAGDRLLQEIARRLGASIRRTDVIARFGGDEFVVLMSDIKSHAEAAIVARKIQEALLEPLFLSEQKIFVNASIGIALYPQDGDADSLIRNADLAMYRAKQQGRNNYQFYSSDLDASNTKRMTMYNELHHALDSGALVLEYQPKVCLQTGAVVGAEALLRWRHPTLGLIPPADFIPLAEETGLIIAIGEWVIRTACEQAKRWQDAKLPGLVMAVNLSVKQLQHYDLVGFVHQTLTEVGLAPPRLELELTESTLMEQLDEAVAVIHRLKNLGVHFSMDDFGTGYSSLNYLNHFPFDHLKLDKSFIHQVATSSHDGEIVKTIIGLGNTLGMKVVAEGVETHAQLLFLRANGCNEAQGYYFSRPLPAAAFAAFIENRAQMLMTMT